MADWLVWGVAVVCGLAGALPQAYLFGNALKGHKDVRMDLGLLSVVVSFVALTLVLLVVWKVAPAWELTFGTVMVSAFLALWGVEAVRAWRVASGRADRRVGGRAGDRPGSR